MYARFEFFVNFLVSLNCILINLRLFEDFGLILNLLLVSKWSFAMVRRAISNALAKRVKDNWIILNMVNVYKIHTNC